MRRELQDSDLPRVLLDYMPHHFFCHFVAPGLTRATDTTKQSSMGDAGSQQPIVNRSLNPSWHRYRSHVAGFADQVNNGPMIFPPLEMVQGQFG